MSLKCPKKVASSTRDNGFTFKPFYLHKHLGKIERYQPAVLRFWQKSENKDSISILHFWVNILIELNLNFYLADIFSFAKDKIANLKLKESVILTLGTLSKKTSDLRVSNCPF